MRLLIFLMFFPALAGARPAMIRPESIIGFLRLDLDKDRTPERVLLTMDAEGTVDLYILPGAAGGPVAYFGGFSATNGDAPTLRAVGGSAFEVVQFLRHGQGSTVFTEKIGWQAGPEAGYYTLGAGFRFSPRNEAGGEIVCKADFANNRLETRIGGGEIRVLEADFAPTRPGDPLPEGWDDLCASRGADP